MRHATPYQLKEIFRLFRAYTAIFPHIRQDARSRRIGAGQCIYEDGVAITYQQYKKRTLVGDVDVPAGAVMLHQIVNSNQFSGAGGHVFERFCAEIVRPLGGELYLSVRQENTTACQFYERHGMRVAAPWRGRVGRYRGTSISGTLAHLGNEWWAPEMAVKVGGAGHTGRNCEVASRVVGGFSDRP